KRAGSISLDGKYVFVDNDGNSGSLWQIATLKPVSTLHSPGLSFWQLSPNAQYAVLADSGNEIDVWDVPNAIALEKFIVSGNNAIPYRFFPDSQRILLYDNENKYSYRVWNIALHKEIGKFAVGERISGLKFTPN